MPPHLKPPSPEESPPLSPVVSSVVASAAPIALSSPSSRTSKHKNGTKSKGVSSPTDSLATLHLALRECGHKQYSDPAARGLVYNRVGNYYFRRGDMIRAADAYKQAMVHLQDPASLLLTSNASQTLTVSVSKGFHQRRCRRHFADTLSNLATIYWKTGQLDQARRLLEQSIIEYDFSSSGTRKTIKLGRKPNRGKSDGSTESTVASPTSIDSANPTSDSESSLSRSTSSSNDGDTKTTSEDSILGSAFNDDGDGQQQDDKSELLLQRANAHHQLGLVQSLFGDTKSAIESLTKAKELRMEALEADVSDQVDASGAQEGKPTRDPSNLVARTFNAMGQVSSLGRDYDNALQYYQKALRLLNKRKSKGNDDKSQACTNEDALVSATLHRIAWIYWQRGDWHGAISMYRDLLVIVKAKYEHFAALGASSDNDHNGIVGGMLVDSILALRQQAALTVCRVLGAMVAVYQETSRLADAEQCRQDALALSRTEKLDYDI